MSIRFACPHCSTTIKAPGESAGKKLPCPKCGLQLAVPTPTGELIIDEPQTVIRNTDTYPGSYARSRQNRAAFLCFFLFVFAALGGGVVFAVFMYLSIAREPETCRELVELLQQEGMKIAWEPRWGNPPSIVITEDRKPHMVRAGYRVTHRKDAEGFRDSDYDVDAVYKPLLRVTVIQLPTAKEAKEYGGATGAIVYGRFIIIGDDWLMEEIEKRLK